MMKIAKGMLLVASVISFILWALIGDDMEANQGYVGGLLTISYVLMILSGVVILVSALAVLITHPKQLKRTLITLGILVLVVAVSFVIADGNAIETSQGVSTVTESKVIGAFLKMFYILLFVTLAIMVFFGLKRIIKK